MVLPTPSLWEVSHRISLPFRVSYALPNAVMLIAIVPLSEKQKFIKGRGGKQIKSFVLMKHSSRVGGGV